MSKLKIIFLSLLLIVNSLSQAQLDENRLAEAQAAIAANDLAKAEEIVAKGVKGSKESELSLVYNQVIADAVHDYSSGDLSRALNLFELAGMIMPEDTSAFLYAGTVATELNRSDIIMRNYQKLLALKTENSQVYEALTYHQLLDGDSTAALYTLEHGLKMFPQDSYLRKQQVNLLISLDRTEEAVSKLNALIQIEPDNANLLFNLGYLYENLGDVEQGRSYYLKSLDADPGYFDASYNLGVILFNEGADMMKELNADEDISVDEYDRKVSEVNVLVEKSLVHFERCAEISPDNFYLWQTLYNAYSFVGDMDKAMAAKDKVDELGGR